MDINKIVEENEIQTKVCYIHSPEYIATCNKGVHSNLRNRIFLVHSLIESYGLLNKLVVVAPRKASYDELTAFHSTDYIDYIKELQETEDLEKYEDETSENYGLGYDCPLFHGLYNVITNVAGGTLMAAKLLANRSCRIAINWGGGWHHGKRDEASGFCYVNDIVLGILHLRKTFDKILYIDFDLHHGDGVEDAFTFTSKVFTMSFHKYEEGFFPGTGASSDIGKGKGQYYTVNVPIRDGIGDEKYENIFKRVMKLVAAKFYPDAIVCQCGADTLAGDPMNSFNLTPIGLGRCLSQVCQMNLPTLILGGGGYHPANTSRCWTYLTSVVLDQEISNDIPEHRYFTCYGPSYELNITPSNRPDENDAVYIDNICSIIQGNLEKLLT